MQEAIRIIKDEHRVLNSVLFSLRAISREALRTGAKPDFLWLRALLSYVDQFPERLHHAKEELYLFRVLERRSSALGGTLARLRREHAANAGHSVRMRSALTHWERGDPRAGALFANVASDFARFNWRHMRLEEREVLPAAQATFTEADWREINLAFAANNDPLTKSRTRSECEAALRRFVPAHI
ncbi:MAG: hemerythrin domain-containing protein [Reyranella sp.]|nr:hemerythrin domain-containing protein [Reyranella sp.]